MNSRPRRRSRGSRGRRRSRCRRPSAERRTRSRRIRRRQYSCRSLATSSVSTAGRRERGLAPTVSPGALVLAAAIPILFLHVHYQPGFGVGFGSTTVNAYLSDFAVLAVVVVARLERVPRRASGRSRAAAGSGSPPGCSSSGCSSRSAYGHVHSAAYAWHTHGVTAAKFAEYALLAPALPLLIRRTRDLVLAALVARALERARDGRRASRSSSARRSSSPAPSDDARRRSSRRRTSPRSPAPRCSSGSSRSPCRGCGSGARSPWWRRVSGVLGMIVAGAIASVLGLATALVALVVVLVAAPRARAAPARRRRRRRRDRPRRRDRDPRQRPRCVRPLPRRVARQAGVAAGEDPDLRAPDRARVDRLRDLEGPSAARRRLGGLGRAGELPAVHPRRARGSSPTCRRTRSRRPRPTAGTACRTCGCRRSRISASIGLALWVAVFAAAAWLAATDGGPGRRGDGVHRARLDGAPRLALDGAGLRRGHSARRADVARVRARGDDCRSDE